MFRPNRVGTPNIHTTPGSAVSSAAFGVGARWSGAMRFSVINAAPVLDFGHNSIDWNGSQAITANGQFAFGQQFTITQPRNGDTVGLELCGWYMAPIPRSTLVFPFLARMNAALPAVMASADTNDIPTALDKQDPLSNGTAVTLEPRQYHYKTQAIVRNSLATLAGTYFHGIAFVDNSAGWNFTDLVASFSVRQLNDQENVGYRDTLR